LHPDLEKFIDISKSFGLKVALISNGILIKKKISSLQKLRDLSITLDAYDYESFSRNRGGTEKQWEQLMESLDALKERFVAEGAAHFGSGWVWLIAANGTLEIVASHDAEQPRFAAGVAPLLVCDLWEHAYYLDYRNDRERFLRAWFDGVVNWDFAAAQHAASASGGRYRYPLGATNGNTVGATARVG
jgi:hypothetical protein